MVEFYCWSCDHLPSKLVAWTCFLTAPYQCIVSRIVWSRIGNDMYTSQLCYCMLHADYMKHSSCIRQYLPKKEYYRIVVKTSLPVLLRMHLKVYTSIWIILSPRGFVTERIRTSGFHGVLVTKRKNLVSCRFPSFNCLSVCQSIMSSVVHHEGRVWRFDFF